MHRRFALGGNGCLVRAPAVWPRPAAAMSVRDALWKVLNDRKCRVAAASGLILLLGAAVAWLAWASSASDKPTPRARQYAAFTQCLLTDAAGVTSASATPIWAGMQQASTSTVAKSQFLAVPPGTAAADDSSYADTLIARNCDVILAVGEAPTHAVSTAAAANPNRRFLVIGSTPVAGNTAKKCDPARRERSGRWPRR